MNLKLAMEIALSKSYRMRPNSIGGPYTSWGVMSRQTCPLRPPCGSSWYCWVRQLFGGQFGDEDLHLNLHPSIEDSTTLPLEDIASISRAFGRLILACKRDSLLRFMLTEEEGDAESSEEDDQPGFSGSVVHEVAEAMILPNLLAILCLNWTKCMTWRIMGNLSHQFCRPF